MPKQIDATGIVLEDLEWTDTKGKKWLIAGDIDVETVTHLFNVLQEARKNEGMEIFNKLHSEAKKLFALRHTEEELQGFKIPFARLMPVVMGIVEALTEDIVGVGDVDVNPTRKDGAKSSSKSRKKK